MKTETNITMEDIGRSEIPEKIRRPVGHNTPVARSSFARLCSTAARRNILVTNFDQAH
jgi:hypothetical protein